MTILRKFGSERYYFPQNLEVYAQNPWKEMIDTPGKISQPSPLSIVFHDPTQNIIIKKKKKTFQSGVIRSKEIWGFGILCRSLVPTIHELYDRI